MVFQALNNGLLGQAFGVYFVHLQQEFGWSKTTLSGAFSLNQLASGIISPLQGWLIERLGSRTMLRIGVIAFAVGLVLASRIHSLASFYWVFLLSAVGASFSGVLAVSVVVAHWFRRKRASALGVASMGQGVGGLLVVVIALAVGHYGWRVAALFSGLVVLVIGLPVTQLMRETPEAHGLLPDGDAPRPSPEGAPRGATVGEPGAAGTAADFSAAEALKTSAFWLLAIGHAASALPIVGVAVHLVPDLVDYLHLTVQAAAGVVALLTGATMVGFLGGGFIGDRSDKRMVAVMTSLVQIVALCFLAFANSLALIIVFAILFGLAQGARNPIMPALRVDYFGLKDFPLIMGFSFLVLTLGTVTAPLLGGYMADRFGSYQGAFLVMAAIAGLGALCLYFARKPSK